MNTVRKSVAVAILAASSLAAACAATGGGGGTPSPVDTQVGKVLSVLYDSVYVAGVLAGDDSPIDDGQHVSTDASGELYFKVQAMTCKQDTNTDIVAIPSSDILAHWVAGVAICMKTSGPAKKLWSGHAFIYMSDPVFTIIRAQHQTTVLVSFGSVTVRTTDVPGTAVVPMYYQDVIVDGHPPEPPTPYDFGKLSPFVQQAIRTFMAEVSPSTPLTPPAQASSSASPLPQTITFISKAPTHDKIGAKYTVMATGGGSGNPVIFSTENSAVCSAGTTANSNGVYSATVSFLQKGTCVIDASQDGNAQYQPALGNQTVTVL